MRITAIVVTYNRKELVVRNIEAVLSQTLIVDKIIVINNNSTDGTTDYISEKFDNNSIIEIVDLDTNSGGAGGFYYGLKYAIDSGYDYAILMDDDGRPYDKYCFEHLIKSITPNDANKPLMINALVVCNENSLTFGLKGTLSVEQLKSFEENGKIVDDINPFNGTLISRSLVEKIGYPNKDFFIKGDEVDYHLRALNAGAIVYTVISSRYFHPAAGNVVEKKILGRRMFIFSEAPVKEYYTIRNRTFSYYNLGKKREAARFFIKNIIRILNANGKKRPILRAMFRGYRDGKKGRLGIAPKNIKTITD